MKKRIRVKGHYRVIERNEKGQFTFVGKWSSKTENTLKNKLKFAMRIKEKYPNSEVGFFHKDIHYTV